MKYDPGAIEQRWQAYWAEHQTFKTPNPGDASFDPDKPKYYVLDMFPYPSGVGLHVGHPLGYIATDICARYKRMAGCNVLHPMGFDAFGLPAEQYAVEHGIHPRETTESNIDNMVRQLKRLGLGYDWDRRLATTDTGYYKWTQWIFLQLYHSWFDPTVRKARPIAELEQLLQNGDYEIGPDAELVHAGAHEGVQMVSGGPVGTRRWYELSREQQRRLIDEYRLAYIDEVPVNWCPELGTVLANEEVTNEGRSERGNYPVYQRPLRQWMLRITAYAERLLGDLDGVDWPEAIKLMQRNWIGRSEGAQVHFALANHRHDGDDAALADAAVEDEQDRIGGEVITVFTTRPDTLFGATYMVLAPEHPLVDIITAPEQYHAVNEYRNRTEEDRRQETGEPPNSEAGAASRLASEFTPTTSGGVFTGAYAINPVNDERIPIWIADYVLMGYGTGAIMAVPAHDERDFAFAQRFKLPVRAVVMPSDHWLREQAEKLADEPGGSKPCDLQNIEDLRQAYLDAPAGFPEAFTAAGEAIHCANDEITLNGLATGDAKRAMIQWLERQSIGRGKVQYKLRDWLFSRQRYWGEPFPILHCPEGGIQTVEESELPVELPEMADFRPVASQSPDAAPQPPLGRADASWRLVQRDGQTCQRELNTMPQWAGSCWYYLRFCDPHNDERFVGRDAEQYWMHSKKRNGQPHNGGVDLYVGGVEHAVLHLLYARFWHKVLFDLGHVSTPEPFGRLYNQGYIQAFAYRDSRGIAVPAEEVVDHDGKPAASVEDRADGKFFHKGEPVTREFGKMGKSLKNAVAPDDVIQQYGADALRLYEMYLGPLDQSKVWRTHDIVGVHRFLQRVWRNIVDEETDALRVVDGAPDQALARLMHRTVKRVSEAMDSLSFNVAIAALIELNNELVALDRVPREVAETVVRLLAPLAPHISEELWQRLGHEPSVADADWPTWEEAMLVEETIELPVQINGKVRGKISVPADADDDAVSAAAVADTKVAAAIGDKTVRKVIVIKGRMVNVVVG